MLHPAQYTASSNAILSLTSFTTRETWQITLGVALITAAYTAYGGLITSISTDFVQGIIVIVLGENDAAALAAPSHVTPPGLCT